MEWRPGPLFLPRLRVDKVVRSKATRMQTIVVERREGVVGSSNMIRSPSVPCRRLNENRFMDARERQEISHAG
jgi:hypothetical protein